MVKRHLRVLEGIGIFRKRGKRGKRGPLEIMFTAPLMQVSAKPGKMVLWPPPLQARLLPGLSVLLLLYFRQDTSGYSRYAQSNHIQVGLLIAFKNDPKTIVFKNKIFI